MCNNAQTMCVHTYKTIYRTMRIPIAIYAQDSALNLPLILAYSLHIKTILLWDEKGTLIFNSSRETFCHLLAAER